MTTLTALPLDVDAWQRYAPASRIDHFRWWTTEHCVQTVGPMAGQPLVFEVWQLAAFGEGMACDLEGIPYWQTVVIIVPRKNGKTTSTSAVSGYEADTEEGTPIVGLAATSDEQCGELFDAMQGFITMSPYLADRFHVRDYEGEIARTDGGAYIRRMRMDWRRLHGKNLSKLIADEIHAWTTPNLRKSWEALTTGDGARPGFQAWCITTEGEPDESGAGILAMLVGANEQYGEVEEHPGLTISRNHEARVLIYRFHAPMPDADPQPVRDAYQEWRDAEAQGAPAAAELREVFDAKAAACARAAKLANPSSWITEDYLRRKALDPKLNRAAFLRYHCCVAAEDDDVWIGQGPWAGLVDADADPLAQWWMPPGVVVALGADGSRTHDTTALACAWPDHDAGTIGVAVRVYSVRSDVPHHVLHRGGTIDYTDVEAGIMDAARVYRVTEAAYDPRFLDRSMDHMAERLASSQVFAVEPTSKHMRAALMAFERAVLDGVVRHNGCPVLTAHLANAVAERYRRTGELLRVVKRSRGAPIDAAMAAAMAVWRASLMLSHRPFVFAGMWR